MSNTNMELVTGSGSSEFIETETSSISEGEQAVAITIACVFVVGVVLKLAHSMYVMRKNRMSREDEESVAVTTRDVGCQTEPMDEEESSSTTRDVGCQTEPMEEEESAPTNQTTDV